MDGVNTPQSESPKTDEANIISAPQSVTQVPEPVQATVSQPVATFTPIQASEIAADIATNKPARGLSMPSFGVFGSKSHIYLVEYLVSLFMLWTLLVVIVTAFSLITEYFADKNSSVFANEGGSAVIMALLAATIISLPIYVLTSIRTRRSELFHPRIMQNNWRKAFLYIALVIVALNGITYGSVLSFQLMNKFFVEDSVNWSKDWPGLINTLFVVVLLGFIYWSYVKVNDTPAFDEDEK